MINQTVPQKLMGAFDFSPFFHQFNLFAPWILGMCMLLVGVSIIKWGIRSVSANLRFLEHGYMSVSNFHAGLAFAARDGKLKFDRPSHYSSQQIDEWRDSHPEQVASNIARIERRNAEYRKQMRDGLSRVRGSA